MPTMTSIINKYEKIYILQKKASSFLGISKRNTYLCNRNLEINYTKTLTNKTKSLWLT